VVISTSTPAEPEEEKNIKDKKTNMMVFPGLG
jgi:hypothetical protein